MYPSVIIAIPFGRNMHPESVQSLLGLIQQSGPHFRKLIYRRFPYVDMVRNQLVYEALHDEQATHLLFLDDDMTWPGHMLHQLLDHNKPVVGALYFHKCQPYHVVAGDFTTSSDPLKIINNLSSIGNGRRRVGWMGLGACLIETGVLRKMRDHFQDQSWFLSTDKLGEDIWFFHRLLNMSIPVYLDQDLECGHIVEQKVTRAHWEACQEV